MKKFWGGVAIGGMIFVGGRACSGTLFSGPTCCIAGKGRGTTTTTTTTSSQLRLLNIPSSTAVNSLGDIVSPWRTPLRIET